MALNVLQASTIRAQPKAQSSVVLLSQAFLRYTGDLIVNVENALLISKDRSRHEHDENSASIDVNLSSFSLFVCALTELPTIGWQVFGYIPRELNLDTLNITVISVLITLT